MKNRIGIFGGPFDPVHLGHLSMAKSAVDGGKLDKVIFVPNGQPPHKDGDSASGEHRFNMLKIATCGFDKFSVSDYELDTSQYHYTVDTMRHFKKMYPDSDVMFILGADSLNYVDKWMDAKNLILENTFLVINRNFDKEYDISDNINRIKCLGGEVVKVDMPFVDISSTKIRQAILTNRTAENLVPDGVWKYIKDNKLYIGENHDY